MLLLYFYMQSYVVMGRLVTILEQSKHVMCKVDMCNISWLRR